MWHIPNIAVGLLPVAFSLALQAAGSVPEDQIAGLIRNVLNLGTGGVIAVFCYTKWQEEVKKRESAENKYNRLLLRLAKLPQDDPDGEDQPL